MFAVRAIRSFVALGVWMLGAPLFTACHSKVTVVCGKLNDCGLLERSTTECEDNMTYAYGADGVDAEKLKTCIDCLGLKYCDEIRAGRCDDDCDEVFSELRTRGLIGPSAATAEGAAGAGP